MAEQCKKKQTAKSADIDKVPWGKPEGGQYDSTEWAEQWGPLTSKNIH